MNQFLQPSPFYSKEEVIACLGILPSQFYACLRQGIIPPPDGRSRNKHYWNRDIINSIAIARRVEGANYTFKHTMDVLLKRLEILERNYNNLLLERLYVSN
jgi:hypothetical protein